jgi:hypothetical protein
MGNAVWLLLVTPEWYFETLFDPLSAGALTLIPAIGTLCLIVGFVAGIRAKRYVLLAFILPFVASELFVAIAGLLRGRLSTATTNSVLFGFLFTQVVLIGFLIYISRGARVSAALLSLFSISYAFFASFVAAMAFTDTWL